MNIDICQPLFNVRKLLLLLNKAVSKYENFFFFKQNYQPLQTCFHPHPLTFMLLIRPLLLVEYLVQIIYIVYKYKFFRQHLICTDIFCRNTVYVIIVYIIVRYNNFHIWYTDINSEKKKIAWPSCISLMTKILQFVCTCVILTFPRHTAKKAPPLDTGSLTLL